MASKFLMNGKGVNSARSVISQSHKQESSLGNLQTRHVLSKCCSCMARNFHNYPRSEQQMQLALERREDCYGHRIFKREQPQIHNNRTMNTNASTKTEPRSLNTHCTFNIFTISKSPPTQYFQTFTPVLQIKFETFIFQKHSV